MTKNLFLVVPLAFLIGNAHTQGNVQAPDFYRLTDITGTIFYVSKISIPEDEISRLVNAWGKMTKEMVPCVAVHTTIFNRTEYYLEEINALQIDKDDPRMSTPQKYGYGTEVYYPYKVTLPSGEAYTTTTAKANGGFGPWLACHPSDKSKWYAREVRTLWISPVHNEGPVSLNTVRIAEIKSVSFEEALALKESEWREYSNLLAGNAPAKAWVAFLSKYKYADFAHISDDAKEKLATAAKAEQEELLFQQRKKEAQLATVEADNEARRKTFRSNLKEGDQTNCGPVIELKKDLVKVYFPVANYGNEHWLRREIVYMSGEGCRFINGQYVGKPN